MFSLLWCYMHTFASLLDSLYHLIFSSSALSVNFFILFLYQKLWVHFLYYVGMKLNLLALKEFSQSELSA